MRSPDRAGRSTLAGLTVFQAVAASCVVAQTTTMPSTLRYGSGLLDVPVSSVLAHKQVTATASGFFLGIDRPIEIDDAGRPINSFAPAVDEFFSDVSLAVGLLDRVETGLSLQAFADPDAGGSLWGLFGRVKLWEPIDQGVGVAVGARWLSSPSFDDGRAYRPARLGFPDDRIRASYDGLRGADTNLSVYGVATAFLRGFAGGHLPENDLTITLGLGSGLFDNPGELDFYSPGHSNGWFVGSALHVEVSDVSMLTLMAEHNGFDVNVGAQMDYDGFRIGAHVLATNHEWPSGGQTSEYVKPKFGLLASIALCPGRAGLRCRPARMARLEPDTIFIPPPPPDTVIVATNDVPPPTGEPMTLCLSTGQNIDVRLTAAGDTLVGPRGLSLGELTGVVALAGRYAAGALWYEAGDPIEFEGDEFGRSEDTFPVDCTQILRVGVHEGVPIFAVVSAQRPLSALFVPVRPGLWRRYERGL